MYVCYGWLVGYIAFYLLCCAVCALFARILYLGSLELSSIFLTIDMQNIDFSLCCAVLFSPARNMVSFFLFGGALIADQGSAVYC